MAAQLEPWNAPVRTYARVIESFNDNRFEIDHHRNIHLRSGTNHPMTYERENDPGPAGDYARLNGSLTVGGGLFRDFGHSFTVRFSQEVRGSIHNYRPAGVMGENFDSRFAFDAVCPAGYSRFEWDLRGISQLIQSRCARQIRMAVGRIQEPTSASNWSSFFDDRIEFYAGEPYMLFPDSWSSERRSVTYPVRPGETVRFFFDFRNRQWPPDHFRWNVMTQVDFTLLFLQAVEESHAPIGFQRREPSQTQTAPKSA
jgi:hypothetical protein